MITINRKIDLKHRSSKKRDPPADEATTPILRGRVPRISRLMALAIHFDEMLRTGKASDLNELAQMYHVSQPRISQILNLTLLAVDIQEELLLLPRVLNGKAQIHERVLRPITAQIGWAKQRKMWEQVKANNPIN